MLKYLLAYLLITSVANAGVTPFQNGSVVSASSAAATYVNKAGDTVTGNLISGSSITTTGGLFGGSLAVAGSTLTVTDGAFTAPSQPFGMLVGAVEQGLGDGSSTERDVFFSTLHSSSVGMGFAVSTASDTLTAQIEGLYDCSGQVAVQPAALTILRAWLYHYHAASASWQVVARDNRDPISGGTSTAYVQKKLYLKAGDGVAMTMAVAGATATQEGDHEYTWLQCAKIR